MNMIRSVVSSLGLVIISCGVAHGYLLQNSFFDDSDIDWDDGVGWESFGQVNAVGRHDWANGAPGVIDPDYFDPLYGQEGDTNWGVAFQCWTATFGGFYQDVPVVPGSNYYFEIESHAGCNSPAGTSFGTTSVFMITFDWYDMDPDLGGMLVAGNTNIIVPKDGGCDGIDLPGDYRFWDQWDRWGPLAHTAPGSATVLRLSIGWDASGLLSSNGSEAVRWDNAFLTTDTLDPANESLDPTDDLLAMSFDAQTSLDYTLKSSTDMDAWSPTVHPEIEGDDTTHTLYDMPGDPLTVWRVDGSQQGNAGNFLNLLSNGDFELPGTGATATDWTPWTWGGAWANTEQAGWGSGSWHLAAGHWGGGGGGMFQLVPAVPGRVYELSVSSGADAWFLPTGRMEMFFFDVTGTNVITNATRKTVDPDVYGADDGVWDELDIPHPWADYSISAVAPTGTVTVKVEFSCNETAWNVWTNFDGTVADSNAVGATGSVGFDNAVLTDGVTINTNPPPAIIPYALDLWQTNSVLIAFDGQVGVVYQLEYSEDSGSTWFETLHPVVVGDGTRQRVYDPEGPSGTRQYRMQPVPLALPPSP